MRLGIEARPLRGVRTGIGNWTWNLLGELPGLIPDLEVFLYLPDGFSCNPPPALTNPIKRRNKPLPGMSGHFWVKWRVRSLVLQDELDVFWAPRTLYPSGLAAKVPVVTTIHDLNAILFPETMKIANLIAHKLWFRSDLLNATKIVSNSEGTARRMKNLIGRDADAIVRPGVNGAFCMQNDAGVDMIRQRYGLGRRYLIFVGTLEPRKNLDQLLLAHRDVNVGLAEPLELLLVGQRGWRNQPLTRQLEAGVVNVRELGFVPDEDLPSLYAGAEAFVMPSLYEGYGMPAAEARACGARLVVSDIPELHEAAGPDAIYVAPTAHAIAKGINLALRSPRPAPRPGQSWKDSASILAEVLKEAAYSSRPG